MRQFPFSVRAPYFPPLTQRSSSQYPCRFPSYCTHALRRILGGERLFHATRVWFRPRTLPSLCLSLCFDQVEFHLAVPTAGGRGRAAAALVRSFPSSFPNRNQQPLNRSSYEKHDQQKGRKERTEREERSSLRFLTPPTEADDRFLFARLNKFPVSVS